MTAGQKNPGRSISEDRAVISDMRRVNLGVDHRKHIGGAPLLFWVLRERSRPYLLSALTHLLRSQCETLLPLLGRYGSIRGYAK